MAAPKTDPEVEAMGKVAAALAGLESEAQARLIRWAADRYRVALSGKTTGSGGPAGGEGGATGSDVDPAEFAEIGDLFAAAAPQTDEDRALVAAYWLQELREGKEPTFGTQSVNKELKHLGHGVSGINKVFDNLVATSPQQVIQTRKSGSSRQARKTYKVTKAGIKRVQELLDS